MEKNKLIAEFLGLTIITDEISLFDTNYKPLCKYHESWNDLIPVVEKIESLNLSEYGYTWKGIDGKIEYNNQSIHVEIERNKCWIYMNLQLDPPHTFNKKTDNTEFPTKIEAVYAAVVEFIEYYNTIKQD